MENIELKNCIDLLNNLSTKVEEIIKEQEDYYLEMITLLNKKVDDIIKRLDNESETKNNYSI